MVAQSQLWPRRTRKGRREEEGPFRLLWSHPRPHLLRQLCSLSDRRSCSCSASDNKYGFFFAPYYATVGFSTIGWAWKMFWESAFTGKASVLRFRGPKKDSFKRFYSISSPSLLRCMPLSVRRLMESSASLTLSINWDLRQRRIIRAVHKLKPGK